MPDSTERNPLGVRTSSTNQGSPTRLELNQPHPEPENSTEPWAYFVFQTSGSGQYSIEVSDYAAYWRSSVHYDRQVAVALYGPGNWDNLIDSKVYHWAGRASFWLSVSADLEGGSDYYVKVFSTYWDDVEGEHRVGYSHFMIIIKHTEVIPLSVNAEPYQGEISYLGEQDWYSFTTAWSGSYTIETHWGQPPKDVGGQLIDATVLFLYGPDSQTKQIYFDYTSGEGRFSRITRTLEAGHTYYVRVAHESDRARGWYGIDVVSQEPRTPTPRPPITIVSPTPRPTPVLATPAVPRLATPTPLRVQIPTSTPTPRPPITIATPTPWPTLVRATPTRQFATPTPPRLQMPTFTPTMTPTPPPAEGFVLGGGAITAEPGASIKVPINVRDLPNTTAISFDVAYDPNLLTWVDDISKQNTLLSSWNMVDVSMLSPGRLLVGAAAFDGHEASGSGTLIVLTFTLKADVETDTTTEILLENLEDGVADATPLPITISIQTGIKGDVDGNGRLTAGDAQMAFEIFMRRITPTDRQQRVADINNDGKVTATDAQMIFELFMGRGNLSGKRSFRLLQATTLSVGSVAANPGEEVTVPIYLTTSSPITALAISLAFDSTRLAFLGFDGTNTLLENFAVVDASEISPGNILIGAAAFGSDPISTSGVLINLRFRLREDVFGPAPISVTGTDDDLAGAATADGGVNMETAVINWPDLH